MPRKTRRCLGHVALRDSLQTHSLNRVPGWPKHIRAYGGWLGSEELKKDVAACDKSRGGGKQPLIREFPNGVTHADEVGIPTTEYIGRKEGT